MKKRVCSILTICLVMLSMSLSAFAHSGRTDGNGGHNDNQNKSGLGGYHYHCGGYPAHLHYGGVCPYSGGASVSYSSVPSTPKPVYATSITATNIPSEIKAGEKTTLEASVEPSDAEDSEISWESSDPSVLLVDSTGALTAVGVGTATITAKTSQGTSAQFTITVNEVVAESICISAYDSEILLGDSESLYCKFVPDNTTNKDVQWSSSDESILAVSSNGIIKAMKIGSATITAAHGELTDSMEIEVLPIDAESVEIILPDDTETNDDGDPKLHKNSQMKLKTKIEPENTTYKEIEWRVSDESVARIDENGVLTPRTTGVVTVTAIARSGVGEEIEIEIYSNIGIVVTAFVGGLALIGGGGVILYYRKKKKNNGICPDEVQLP